MKKNTFLSLIALFVAAFVLSACGGAQSSPSATVKAFYAHVEANEIEEAVALIDPSVTEQPQAKEKLKSMLSMGAKQMEKDGGLKDLKIDDEKIDGDNATVSVTMTMGDEEPETDTMKLVRVDGKWFMKMN